ERFWRSSSRHWGLTTGRLVSGISSVRYVTSQKYREEWHGSWYNVAMRLTLPEIPEAENTSLVRQLLEIIRTQQDRIQQLEDEILRLKGLKTRPVIAPSPLEHPPRPPREPGQKRPGSAKRSKTAQLVITDEVV